jgi:hypothetical protein
LAMLVKERNESRGVGCQECETVHRVWEYRSSKPSLSAAMSEEQR